MPSVFITYRRQDTAAHAGRLSDRLRSEFGASNVFMDVDAIGFGQDFTKRIEEGVASCDVLLVLIGHQWLTVKNDAGQRRLEDPEDFIRLEVQTGLDRDVLVIPVLVEGAQLPVAKDLPESMAKLARHQAIELRNTSWREDVERLVKAIWTASPKPGLRSRLTGAGARLKTAPRAVKGAGAVALAALVAAIVLLVSAGGGGGGGSAIKGGLYTGPTSQGNKCGSAGTGGTPLPNGACAIQLRFSPDRKFLLQTVHLFVRTCSSPPMILDSFSIKLHVPALPTFVDDISALGLGHTIQDRIHIQGRFTGPRSAAGSFTVRQITTAKGLPCRDVSGTFTAHA